MKIARDVVELLGFLVIGILVGGSADNAVIGLFIGAVLFLCVRSARKKIRSKSRD